MSCPSNNETNQNYQFRSVGSYSHGAFKNVDETQIETLSAHPKVKAAGERTVIGLCTAGVFAKEYGEVSFMDDNNARWSYALPTVGRTPKAGKEIAMDTKALALLGCGIPSAMYRQTAKQSVVERLREAET